MAAIVGEQAWLNILPTEAPSDIEGAVAGLEVYKQAVDIEPWSVQIWLRYCLFMSSLSSISANWSEEEQEIGKELFGSELVDDVFRNGYSATTYNIRESHILWDAWIEILISAESALSTSQIEQAFMERLQIPHATWDKTSQQFSSWISATDESRYEELMQNATMLASAAKKQYDRREPWEMKLISAERSGNDAALKTVYIDYLHFESIQSKVDKTSGQLRWALFRRALVKFPQDAELWLDYCLAVSVAAKELTTKANELQDPLEAVVLATKHCPASQDLWAVYILQAQMHCLSQDELLSIMHTAASNIADIAGAVTLYSAWSAANTNIDLTRSIKAIKSAIKEVRKFGLDPTFSVERCLIQAMTDQLFMSEEQNPTVLDEVRAIWRELVKSHKHSYDFWLQWYEWEMRDPGMIRNASYVSAASVLSQGIKTKEVDWPEKLLEVYKRHATLYMNASDTLTALLEIRRNENGVARRRAREAAEAAAAYAQQDSAVDIDMALMEVTGTNGADNAAGNTQDEAETSPGTKRKREDSIDASSKKPKPYATASPEGESSTNGDAEPKRDRENLSVMVYDLPHDATQTAVKKFFKEYGHIMSLDFKRGTSNNDPSTACIEFETAQDVDTALLRNGKPFVVPGSKASNGDPNDDDNIGAPLVRVVPASKQTLYITNFPRGVDGDDAWANQEFGRFGAIFPPRWPNKQKSTLLANQHRRFLYITFLTPEGARKALALDGKRYDDERGHANMFVMYSNPTRRKERVASKKVKKPRVEGEGGIRAEIEAESRAASTDAALSSKAVISTTLRSEAMDVDSTSLQSEPQSIEAESTKAKPAETTSLPESKSPVNSNSSMLTQPPNASQSKDSSTNTTATTAQAKFIPQPAIRRPVLGLGRKKRGGGKLGGT